MTNSLTQQTLLDEIDSILISIYTASKNYIIKHHWILGYF